LLPCHSFFILLSPLDAVGGAVRKPKQQEEEEEEDDMEPLPTA
jgi:hypothetical protein